MAATDDPRVMQLVKSLETDSAVRGRLARNPVSTLAQFGLRGDDAIRVLGQLMMGELRVPQLGRAIGILSPWPPRGVATREILEVVPSTIRGGERTKILIRARGLDEADGILFRNELVRGGEFYADSVEVDLDAGTISGWITLEEPAPYDVWIGQRNVDDAFGSRERGLTVVS